MSVSYVYNEKLGQGAFGAVWKCKTPLREPFARENQFVALKVVKNPDQNSAKEVSVLKELSHG